MSKKYVLRFMVLSIVIIVLVGLISYSTAGTSTVFSDVETTFDAPIVVTDLQPITIIPQDVIGLFWWLRYGYGQGPGSWPWSRNEGYIIPIYIDEYAPGGDIVYGPPWPPLSSN